MGFPGKRSCFVWLTTVMALAIAGADASRAQDDGNLRVFLDCGWCDDDRIRAELTVVDYVRDPEQADVHVFVTMTRTVLSGRQYEFSFIGRQDYDQSTIRLTRAFEQNTPSEEIREAFLEAILLGLAPFLGQDAQAAEYTLVAENGRRAEAQTQLSKDPWRHWVFNVYGGDFELDLESNRYIFDSRWGFYADHRNETWKVRVRPYFNYDLVRIERDNRPTVRSSITRHGLDSYLIRSLGPHWSVGLFGNYITRNDRNLKHWGSLVPGIEYSILPYSVATRRAVTAVYTLGLTYAEYYEETIFSQTEEWLPHHELDLSVSIRQPWGDIYSGLEGSQYLNDRSKQRAEFFMNVSVRLFAGFSLDVEGQFEMIRDQLSLPKGDASLEEILLQQRELATDFNLGVSVAFSYTFGSSFANVVNTRF